MLFGEHDLKLVSRYFVKREATYQGVPGDRKTYLNGTDLDRQIEYFSNDPRLEAEARHGYFIRQSTGQLLVNSLTDSMQVGRYLAVNAGLALHGGQ